MSVLPRPSIGQIHLEGMMYRCGILCVLGYRFIGLPDLCRLRASFEQVIGQVDKFCWDIQLDHQGQVQWQYRGPRVPAVIEQEAGDLHQAFAQCCAELFTLHEQSQQCPMMLVIVRQPAQPEQPEACLLIQVMDHAYCDARSSEVLWGLVMDHYLASLHSDAVKQGQVLSLAKKLSTPGSNAIYRMGSKHALLPLPWHQHVRNVWQLVRHKQADGGGYAIPFKRIRAQLPAYCQSRREPIMRWVDLRHCIAQCRQQHAALTSNSVVTALVAQAVRQVNLHHKQLPPEKADRISFRMLADILSPRQRKQYLGNYIAYVPLTLDASLPLAELALQVEARVSQCRQQRIDLSQFRFLETAISRRWVGKVDDPVSYAITSVSNHRLNKAPHTLPGARFVEMLGAVNAQPRDEMGGLMNNKPVICTVLSPGQQLFLTFYPMIGPDDDNRRIADYVALLAQKSNG